MKNLLTAILMLLCLNAYSQVLIEEYDRFDKLTTSQLVDDMSIILKVREGYNREENRGFHYLSVNVYQSNKYIGEYKYEIYEFDSLKGGGHYFYANDYVGRDCEIYIYVDDDDFVTTEYVYHNHKTIINKGNIDIVP